MSDVFFKVVTRRKAAAGVATATVAGAGVAGCGIIGPNGVNPAVMDAINGALATGCGVLATASTIAAVIATAFPAAAGVATIGEDIIAQIVSYICAGVKTSQSKGGVKNFAPVALNGVAIHGWDVEGGKFVAF